MASAVLCIETATSVRTEPVPLRVRDGVLPNAEALFATRVPAETPVAPE